jgi:serine/arginine repetitive matrix protein 2
VSPSGPPPGAPLNSNEARLQKALTHSSSFGRSSPRPWPPPPSEPSLSLLTPPRRQSSSSPKVEFDTPPPPKGLPELPGPPSSSDDEGDAEGDWVSVKGNTEPHLDISSMKTPKPPGAWTSTPLLSRRDTLVRAHTLPDSGESTSEGGLVTPVASLSRAFSLPAQTPAPPGAWLATPGIDRRRSVLKVRFDVESEQSASDAHANGYAHVADPNGHQTESPSESSFEVSTPKAQANGLPQLVEVIREAVDVPVTPRSTPPPSIRRSPSIRVVDAFGREQIPSTETVITQDSVVTLPALNTPRNKSSVRIVDAMGREVEEATSGEGKSQGDTLGHTEALKRVRQSIADLASGLGEVDRYVIVLYLLQDTTYITFS